MSIGGCASPIRRAFLAMFIEGVIRGAPSPRVGRGGRRVFAIAKIVKWWAIVTLGPAWTFRVIVVPGSRLVASGPYRILRHPNYVAVVGELVGVALMTGARFAGPVATVAFGLLMMKRVAVENRALDAILRRVELSTTLGTEDAERTASRRPDL